MNNEGATSLNLASKNCDLEIIKLLLEKDAEVNIPDEMGQTPLHLVAVEVEYKNILKLLLGNVGDINQVNHRNESSVAEVTKKNDNNKSFF